MRPKKTDAPTSKRARLRLQLGGRFRADEALARAGRNLTRRSKLLLTTLAAGLLFLTIWFFGSLVGPLLIFAPIMYFTWNPGNRLTPGELRWTITLGGIGAYFLLSNLVAAGTLFLVLVVVLAYVWLPALWRRRGGGNYASVFGIRGEFRSNVMPRAYRRARRRAIITAALLLLASVPTAEAREIDEGARCGWLCSGNVSKIVSNVPVVGPILAPLATVAETGAKLDFALSGVQRIQAAQPPPPPPPAPPVLQVANTANIRLANFLESIPFVGGYMKPVVNQLRSPEVMEKIVQLAEAAPSESTAPTMVERLKEAFIPPKSFVYTQPSGMRILVEPGPALSPVSQGVPELVKRAGLGTVREEITLGNVPIPDVIRDGTEVQIPLTLKYGSPSVTAVFRTSCSDHEEVSGVPVDVERKSWTVTYTVACRKLVSFTISTPEHAGWSGHDFSQAGTLVKSASQEGAFMIKDHAPEVLEISLVGRFRLMTDPVTAEPGDYYAPTNTYYLNHDDEPKMLTIEVNSPDAGDREDVPRNVGGLILSGALSCTAPPCRYPVDEAVVSFPLPAFPPGRHVIKVQAFGAYDEALRSSSSNQIELVVFETNDFEMSLRLVQPEDSRNLRILGSYTCSRAAWITLGIHWGVDTNGHTFGTTTTPPTRCITTPIEWDIMAEHTYPGPNTYKLSIGAKMIDANRNVLVSKQLRDADGADHFTVTLTAPPSQEEDLGSTDEQSPGEPADGEFGDIETPPPGEPTGSTTWENLTAAGSNAANSGLEGAKNIGWGLFHGTTGVLFGVAAAGLALVGGFWFARQRGLLSRWGIHPKPGGPSVYGTREGWLKRLLNRRSPAEPPKPAPSITFNLDAPADPLPDIDDTLDTTMPSKGEFRRRNRRS